jgi:hypothetical protein
MSADRPPAPPVPPADFLAIQRQFTDHLRDPEHHPPPAGIEDRRLAIYRNAVFGNMDEFMGDNFPRLKECLGAEGWKLLMRDYLIRHRAITPLFPKLAEEFLHYLAWEREDATDPLFLHELAQYDWLESEVNIDPTEVDLTGIDRAGDPLAGVPVLNPVHRLVTFQFPVHRIGPDYQPADPPPQPTFLLVFRDLAQQEGFIELNAVAARLFELARWNAGSTGHALLLAVAAELRHPNPAVVVAGGLEILTRWRLRDVLLGTRASPAPTPTAP